MAYTPLNLGYTPTAGLKYTATVDSSADFGLVPNNTYFFNKADQEVYYKDSTGTVLVIFGTAFTVGGSAWKPMDLALDSWLSSGSSTLLNANAGFQKSFPANANGEVLAEIPLDNQNIAYDGSGMFLRLTWQLFSTIPSAGNDVQWRLDYVFCAVGDDGDSKAATTVTTSIDVTGRTPDILYVDDLPIMTGAVGDKVLGITLARLGGGGGDTYNSDVDVFGIELVKV